MFNSDFTVPHTLVLLFGMIVLAWLAAHIMTPGSFETAINEQGREVVVLGTFNYLEDVAPPAWYTLLTVIPRGLAQSQGIIFFVFIIGGALAMLRATGAIDALMSGLLRRFATRPALLILIGLLACAIGSSTRGILGIAGIPYTRWLRFILPLIIQLLVLGSITLVIAVMLGIQ